MMWDANAERAYILQLIEEMKQRGGTFDNLSAAISKHAEEMANPKPDNPIARSMADLVTPKQLVAIRAIANSQGVGAEAKCLELLKCRPEQLNKKTASWFIDELKKMQSQRDLLRHAS
ncbi:MAG: hypothetical protein WBV94_29610 [Blastocatellia bacterium]